MPDMRFAPPLAMRVGDRGGGLNQTSVRTYNERLVMSLLRQHGSLSRMELGRRSGLSAQTVSVIVRALERDNLVLPGEAQRGRVGPPSTPILLNPEGAFSIGASIAATTIDVALIDFNGMLRQHRQINHTARDSLGTLEEVVSAVAEFSGTAASAWRDHVVGVGISLPDYADSRSENEPAIRGIWNASAVEAAIATVTDLPIFIQNDVTAAAGAEVIFGAARRRGDFAYLFVGRTSECRLVLDHRVYAGSPRSALRTPGETATSIVSLSRLEELASARGFDPKVVWQVFDHWEQLDAILPQWIDECATSLARMITNIAAFVHIGAVVIDGRLPRPVLARLCESAAKMSAEDRLADDAPQVVPGKVGPFAKAIGAASLPLHSRFMVEQVGLAPQVT
jgi:predicted NBD/HSP70 family sugar kinase